MFSRVLSCIEALTISASVAFPDGFAQALARELLARAGRDGSAAVGLEVLAAALGTTPAAVVEALRALYAAGLLAFGVVPVSGGAAWVVVWFAGFAGEGAAIVTGNVSSDAASGGLFVCLPDLPGGVDINNNKQTNNTRGRACAREEVVVAEGLLVTGNISGDAAAGGERARIVALLTDQAVTRGLVAGGLVVGAMVPDKARDLARDLLAAGHDFDFVLANVCEWRRQVEAGRLHAPIPALVTRLRRGFTGSITTADRAEAWFVRHCPPAFDLGIAPPVVVEEGLLVTGNVSGDTAAAAVDVDPVAAAWARMVAGLEVDDRRLAGMLEGSTVAPGNGNHWSVRLSGNGARFVDWLRDRAGLMLRSRWGFEIGQPVAGFEFVTAAAGDD